MFIFQVPVAPGSMEKKKDFWDYAKKKILNDKLIKRVKEFSKMEEVDGIIKVESIENIPRIFFFFFFFAQKYLIKSYIYCKFYD